MRSERTAVVVLALIAIAMSLASQALAGANPQNKIAVHVVPHGASCGSLPAFRYCSDIATTYPPLGDIDVIPVFFDLNEYLVVEFGLTWPAGWGSMDYTRCAGDLAIGGIVRPGDGIATAWTECQRTWSVSHGYGWLNAASPGLVEIVTNPATGDYGVVDCEPGDPAMDYPAATYEAGVGGLPGGNPCGIVILPLHLTVTDGLGGGCTDRWDSVTYTISYSNDVNFGAVTGVILTDSLPDDAEFVSASSGGIYDPTTHTATWLVGELAPAETGSRALAVRIIAPAGSRLTNRCRIQADETGATVASRVTNVCAPNYLPLGLAKTAPGGCAETGDSVTYTISYDNAANPDTVHNVVLTDHLPSGTTFVSASPGALSDGLSYVTWNLGTLAPGQAGSQQVTVRVEYAARLYNRCQISSDEAPGTETSHTMPVCPGPPRNWGAKIAVHLKAHETGCRSIPVFRDCHEIVTTYDGCGDVDAIPVFYDLIEVSVLEFGLRWPQDWGSCSFTRCAGDLAIGGIVNPGDGIAIAWTACQQVWHATPGIVWFGAGTPGLISPCSNPATGDLGVVNCAPSPGPYYDHLVHVARGGACGAAGDSPECGGPQSIQPTTWGAIKAMFK